MSFPTGALEQLREEVLSYVTGQGRWRRMGSPSKPSQSFDLIVIGSGAAGGSAAEVAHADRHSVAIIEKDRVGGDCPNYACVPTKALLRSAKVYALLKRADEFGLRASAVDFDWAQVMAHKEWILRHTGAARAEQQYREAEYKCNACGKTFNSEKELQEHAKTCK
jgi:pyruvate/2-oxoglutarate dehydrogenase complex dihydrolipoamide dehydrogenase (E3) component